MTLNPLTVAIGVTLDAVYVAGRVVSRIACGPDRACRCMTAWPYHDSTGVVRCSLCAKRIETRA